MRFALPDEVDNGNNQEYNYTEQQYESFGWARDVGGITSSELDDLFSKIQARKTLRTFRRSSRGEAIIEVNNDPHKALGVDNVFVFVRGSKESFTITRTVRFNAETETEMEIIKERLYERRAFSNTHLAFLEQQGFATQYTREGAKSFSEYQNLRGSGETSRRTNRNNRKSSKYRSGYSLSTSEDGETIESFADGTTLRYSLPDDWELDEFSPIEDDGFLEDYPYDTTEAPRNDIDDDLDGLYIASEEELEGVNNIIVYAKGAIDQPIITRGVEIF